MHRLIIFSKHEMFPFITTKRNFFYLIWQLYLFRHLWLCATVLLLASLFIYFFFLIIFLTAFVSICPSHTQRETSKNALIFQFFIHPLTLFFSAFRLITICCFCIEFLQFSVRGNEEMTIWKKKERERKGDRLEFFERQTKFINLIRSFFFSLFFREHRNDKMKLLSRWYFDNKV